ncbi:hypothetical protein EPN29_00645 [bacterium]|nr:MAG: hypothetical protein EPN29_00645 [bacterium]
MKAVGDDLRGQALDRLLANRQLGALLDEGRDHRMTIGDAFDWELNRSVIERQVLDEAAASDTQLC